MNTQEWFVPRRKAALVFVLIGVALQIYSVAVAAQAYINGIGVGLLVSGLAIELIGQIVGSDSPS